MTRRLRFCAECGATEVPLHDNFCQECYWRHTHLAELKKNRIELPYCLECGSVKLSSGWTGPNARDELPEVIGYAHFSNISTSPEVIIDIAEITDLNWVNPNPDFSIFYAVTSDLIPEFEPHTENLELYVKINGGTCTTCVKRKTGSGDVTVQFRAKNRKITKEETDTATTIAFTLSAEMSYEAPEAYINDIVENYGGLDFYFGNTAIAEKFIENVKNRWIGHYEKNYKLVTEDKDERRIYAVTHLYRLPEVVAGDFVAFQEDLYTISSVSKVGIHLISLVDLHREMTKNWSDLSPLDPAPPLVKKMVISEDINANTYLFMDLQSYENEEVSRNQFPKHLEVSKEISVLKWKDKYYLLPENYQTQDYDFNV